MMFVVILLVLGFLVCAVIGPLCYDRYDQELDEPEPDVADAMFEREHDLRCAEAELDMLLDEIYGRDGWRHWDVLRSSRSIHVYGVVASGPAYDALRRAGFDEIVQHEHDYAEFRNCLCARQQEPRLRLVS